MPVTELVSVILAGSLLHILAFAAVAVINGNGVTVTVKVDGVPGQPCALVGVMIYAIMALVLAVGSVLTSTSFIVAPLPEVEKPVALPDTSAAVHVNVAAASGEVAL